MFSTAVAFVLAFMTATVLTPWVRKLAFRVGAVDLGKRSSTRKVNDRPVARMGGLAIVVAYFMPLVGLLVADSGMGQLFLADKSQVVGLFAGGLLIAALGVYDDLKGANAKKKLAVQVLAAMGMYAAGFRISSVSVPFLPALDLPPAVGFLLSVGWIVGVTNAFNLVDGLDGLAAGVALISTSSLLVLSALAHLPLLMLMAGALSGALLGFLFLISTRRPFSWVTPAVCLLGLSSRPPPCRPAAKGTRRWPCLCRCW